MILINGREVSAAYVGGKALAAIYAGARQVWMAVRSCFGAGFWVAQKPWLGSEGWKTGNR